jgi:hypothetical protein
MVIKRSKSKYTSGLAIYALEGREYMPNESSHLEKKVIEFR